MTEAERLAVEKLRDEIRERRVKLIGLADVSGLYDLLDAVKLAGFELKK